MSANHDNIPKAAEFRVATCSQGICFEMLDKRGRVICHAHGFDVIEVYRYLGELIMLQRAGRLGDA